MLGIVYNAFWYQSSLQFAGLALFACMSRHWDAFSLTTNVGLVLIVEGKGLPLLIYRTYTCTVQFQLSEPRLSELWSQAKVQVKVQMSGTVLMCTYVVECSAAIVCSVCANDS